jgi:hypothetical protein
MSRRICFPYPDQIRPSIRDKELILPLEPFASLFYGLSPTLFPHLRKDIASLLLVRPFRLTHLQNATSIIDPATISISIVACPFVCSSAPNPLMPIMLSGNTHLSNRMRTRCLADKMEDVCFPYRLYILKAVIRPVDEISHLSKYIPCMVSALWYTWGISISNRIHAKHDSLLP